MILFMQDCLWGRYIPRFLLASGVTRETSNQGVGM